MATGRAAAAKEAHKMVSEEIEANLALQSKAFE
jgi:hypothetical protein